MIRHRSEPLTITAGTTASGSTAIPFGDFAGGHVYIPNGSSITTLTMHASADGVTYYEVYSAGAALSVTVAADKSADFPDGVFGARFLKLVANAAGTVYVTLKS